MKILSSIDFVGPENDKTNKIFITRKDKTLEIAKSLSSLF